MITKVIEMNGSKVGVFPDGSVHKVTEYYGLSTDTKPTAGVRNGDVFCEMDTMDVYLFDADNGAWLPQQ